MLDYLIGRIKEKTNRSVVLEVGGMGLKALISEQTAKGLPALGKPTKLFVFLRLKAQEGEFELMGFGSEAERNLFWLLTTIDKIGPKTALNILSAAPLVRLQTAIASKKIEFLTSIVGLTEKTANRLVIELAKKVKDLSHSPDLLDLDVQLEEALVSLGFTKREARSALEKLDAFDGDLNARLKKALKVLKNN